MSQPPGKVAPFFRRQQHRILAQHVRESEHGTGDETRDHYIHINQYTPLSNREARTNDFTVIAAAGIGMIKEVYEPLFEEIARNCQAKGVHVRSFWIADPSCVGKSAVANADVLGNEADWFDHSRDLLQMVNHFRREMPRPIVGLGHSMGGAQIAYLSLLHPHLFHTLLLVEPAIYTGQDRIVSLAQARAMSRRREVWPSRDDAAKSVRQNPFYADWDTRAVDLLIRHSFISPSEAPTAVQLSSSDALDKRVSSKDLVMTTTPRLAELNLIYKANLRGIGRDGLDATSAADRAAVPDMDPNARWVFPFYRPEPYTVLTRLPQIRPSVCYVLGSASVSSKSDIRQARLANTGRGAGGSGGAPLGRVVERVIDGGGHYIAFDRLFEVSKHCANWLDAEMQRWAEERRKDAEYKRKPPLERMQPPPVMLEALAEWHPKKSPDIEKLVKGNCKVIRPLQSKYFGFPCLAPF